jgi:hypothetical protein
MIRMMRDDGDDDDNDGSDEDSDEEDDIPPLPVVKDTTMKVGGRGRPNITVPSFVYNSQQDPQEFMNQFNMVMDISKIPMDEWPTLLILQLEPPSFQLRVANIKSKLSETILLDPVLTWHFYLKSFLKNAYPAEADSRRYRREVETMVKPIDEDISAYTTRYFKCRRMAYPAKEYELDEHSLEHFLTTLEEDVTRATVNLKFLPPETKRTQANAPYPTRAISDVHELEGVLHEVYCGRQANDANTANLQQMSRVYYKREDMSRRSLISGDLTHLSSRRLQPNNKQLSAMPRVLSVQPKSRVNDRELLNHIESMMNKPSEALSNIQKKLKRKRSPSPSSDSSEEEKEYQPRTKQNYSQKAFSARSNASSSSSNSFPFTRKTQPPPRKRQVVTKKEREEENGQQKKKKKNKGKKKAPAIRQGVDSSDEGEDGPMKVSQISEQRRNTNIQCFECGERGHPVHTCPRMDPESNARGKLGQGLKKDMPKEEAAQLIERRAEWMKARGHADWPAALKALTKEKRVKSEAPQTRAIKSSGSDKEIRFAANIGQVEFANILADPGAHRSIIPLSLYEEHEEEWGPLQKSDCTQVESFDGKKVAVAGLLELPVTVSDPDRKDVHLSSIMSFLVVSQKAKSALAGIDFLTRFFSAMHFQDRKLHLRAELYRGVKEQLPEDSSEPVQRHHSTPLRVSRPVRIPAYSSRVVQVRFDPAIAEKTNQTMMLLPVSVLLPDRTEVDLSFPPQIIGADSRVSKKKEKDLLGLWKVAIVNNTSDEVVLNNQQVVGEVVVRTGLRASLIPYATAQPYLRLESDPVTGKKDIGYYPPMDPSGPSGPRA